MRKYLTCRDSGKFCGKAAGGLAQKETDGKEECLWQREREGPETAKEETMGQGVRSQGGERGSVPGRASKALGGQQEG